MHFCISSNINWEQFREQKKNIVECLEIVNDTRAEQLEGTLNFLDHIQDMAVESSIWTEEEVFGKYDQETGEFHE